MPRPRREEFISDVRRSARMLQKPNVEADSDALDTDAISRILHRAALWLTPKVVEHYDPDDFADEQADQQNRLRLAVEEFRQDSQSGLTRPTSNCGPVYGRSGAVTRTDQSLGKHSAC